MTYGTQKYNQVSYFVQERAFKKQVWYSLSNIYNSY